MNKIIKLLKKLIICFIFLLVFIIIFVIDCVFESVQINDKVNAFISRGVLTYENENKHYYKVIKKYDYEDISYPIIRDFSSSNVGSTGDIYISNRNPIELNLVGYISKHIYIGHSALVYDELANNTIEVIGNGKKEENCVKLWDNKWIYEKSPNFIFLRVKGMNDNLKDKFINECDKIMGEDFNYNFLFNNNKKHYCSELVTYLYNKLGYNLNNDYYASTGADYITNDNTYIIYYQEKVILNNKTHFNIYYLAGE